MSTWSAERILDQSRSWVSPWRPPGSTHVTVDGFEMYVADGRATLMDSPRTDLDWVQRAVEIATARGAESLDVTVSPDYAGMQPALDELTALDATVVATYDVLALDLLVPFLSAGSAPGVRVIEVGSDDEVDDFERTSALAWGYPPPTLADLADARLRLTPGWFLAHRGETPAGTGGFALVEHVARLWGSAVVPAHRGLGVYRELVTRRVAVARERGASLALVHAAPTSSPILQHLGFGRFGRQLTFRVSIPPPRRPDLTAFR